MYNASANDLERVASDLDRIAQKYQAGSENWISTLSHWKVPPPTCSQVQFSNGEASPAKHFSAHGSNAKHVYNRHPCS